MNIEESIELLKGFNAGDERAEQFKEAIEALLTVYEKEKETSHYIQSQLDIANAKLVEEKEKNKDARDMIEYYLIENNSLNDFDKRNKELRKLKKVLEG